MPVPSSASNLGLRNTRPAQKPGPSSRPFPTPDCECGRAIACPLTVTGGTSCTQARAPDAQMPLLLPAAAQGRHPGAANQTSPTPLGVRVGHSSSSWEPPAPRLSGQHGTLGHQQRPTKQAMRIRKSRLYCSCSTNVSFVLFQK